MFQLQCFPLYSLLLAMGSPTVNLLVLDVEGAETLVLRTLPWDKVDIEVSAIQCCGSGSVLDLYSGAFWIRIRIPNTDPDPHM